MKTMKAAVLVMLAAVAGAGERETWRTAPHAMTREGLGALCPYSVHEAYTAWHMVVQEVSSRWWFMPILWESDGAAGTAVPLYSDARRDLAVVWSDEPFPTWFERATVMPAKGDKLVIVGIDWERAGAPRKRYEVTVSEAAPWGLRFRGNPGPGSSGGCVLDAEGRLVAIEAWGWGRPGGGATSTGMAPTVWGEWGVIPPGWRDTDGYGWTGEKDLRLRRPEVEP